MRGHEGRELRRVVVRAHEQIALVLVGRVARRRLRGRRQPLEVKLVRVSLAVDFRHYIFVIVIPAQMFKRYS